MLSNIRVGDRVKSCLAGWGEVALLKEDHVVVNFGPRRIKYFDYEGKNTPWDKNPEIVEVHKREWEPQTGRYMIDALGNISRVNPDFTQEVSNVGRCYPTVDLAEKAYSLIRPFQRLVAWVLEKDPKRSTVDSDYTIIKNENGRYVVIHTYFQHLGVNMPRHVAIELAEKLNSGEVKL